MKTTKRVTAALMLVALAAVLAVSCGKDSLREQPSGDSAVAGERVSSDSLVSRILGFGRLLESYTSSDAVRETQYMAVSDAVVDIEALFNYTFSNSELCYGQTVVLDTTLFMTVTPDDSVSLPVLADFYGRMHNAVSALYHSVDLPDKRFLILDVGEGTSLNGRLSVPLHTVQGSVDPSTPPTLDPGSCPFGEGECWFWANGLGNCSGGDTGNDAGNEIASRLNSDLVPEAPGGQEYFYAPVTSRYSPDPTEYPYQNALYPNPYGPGVPTYCAFFKATPVSEGDYQLDSVLLNFHYFGVRELVLYRLPAEYPVPSYYDFFHVSIDGRGDFTAPAIGHGVTACYGVRYSLESEKPRVPGEL